MKKKILSVFLVSVCTLSLIGCANEAATEPTAESVVAEDENVAEDAVAEETTAETVTEETMEETAQDNAEKPARNNSVVETPAQLSDNLYDFQIAIDGTVYQFPMWAKDFEALGWTYVGDPEGTIASNEYAVSEEWEKDGVTVFTTMANLSINAINMMDSMVAGIDIEEFYLSDSDWEIILPGGIRFGVSTAADIIAAYGEPSDVSYNTFYDCMEYKYDAFRSVEFYISSETNTFDEIELLNVVELEGIDRTVHTEVPQVVTNYMAPTTLGNNLYEYHIELEGNLYTLPCPVSELLANGFTIDEENTDLVIGGRSSGWIEIEYNGQRLRTFAYNYSDYATNIENCFLADIQSNIFGPDYQLVIPCDIQRGDSEESLLEKLKGFNYEVETSAEDLFTYYKIINPDGMRTENFNIIVQDGEVIIIEVSTNRKPE